MLRGGLVGIAVVASLVALPSAATAATASGGSDTVIWTAAADVQNDVTVRRSDDTVVVSDPSDPVTAIDGERSPCAIAAGALRCPAALLQAVYVDTGNDADTVRADSGLGAIRFIVRAGSGDDRLSGAEGADLLYGEEGDDSIVGGPGDDVLQGGPGRDTQDCGTGADLTTGGDDERLMRSCETREPYRGPRDITSCGGSCGIYTPPSGPLTGGSIKVLPGPRLQVRVFARARTRVVLRLQRNRRTVQTRRITVNPGTRRVVFAGPLRGGLYGVALAAGRFRYAADFPGGAMRPTTEGVLLGD